MDREIFYVKDVRGDLTASDVLIPAKFLKVNGEFIKSVIPGEGQKWGMYDSNGKPPNAIAIEGASAGQTHANPNDYVIVPATYEFSSAQL